MSRSLSDFTKKFFIDSPHVQDQFKKEEPVEQEEEFGSSVSINYEVDKYIRYIGDISSAFTSGKLYRIIVIDKDDNNHPICVIDDEDKECWPPVRKFEYVGDLP